MGYKKLAAILFILIVFSFGTFIFYQRSRGFTGITPEEPEQLYVLEIYPESKYLADSLSGKFYEALQPEAGIIVRNQKNALPNLLKLFNVEYIFLRDKKYWELFEPFLEYSLPEEKEDLPRTFPVKKEALFLSDEPFLVLGEGWYALGKDLREVGERGFGKEAIIRYVIPPGALSRAPDILTFSTAWSPLSEKRRKAEIEIIVNGESIYFSDSYDWAAVKLNYLQEGINEIKLRSPQGCVVPEKDDRCFSFIIQRMDLLSSEDIPPEGLIQLDRFVETEGGQYWAEQGAAIHIFTLFSASSLVTFKIQAAGKEPRMISIIEKDKEIKRIILLGGESQEIELLTYQQRKNKFYFTADDCEDKTIEEQKRCITFQIKDLEIKLTE